MPENLKQFELKALSKELATRYLELSQWVERIASAEIGGYRRPYRNTKLALSIIGDAFIDDPQRKEHYRVRQVPEWHKALLAVYSHHFRLRATPEEVLELEMALQEQEDAASPR